MGRVAGKKLFSIMALCAMVGLLLLPIAVSLPSLAMGADAPDAVKKEGEAKVEKGVLVVGGTKETTIEPTLYLPRDMGASVEVDWKGEKPPR